MPTTAVVRALGALAHDRAHPPAPGCDCAPARVLADRADGTVVRRGALVAKAHAPDTDPRLLAARLALAAAPPLTGVLLAPLLPHGPARSLLTVDPVAARDHGLSATGATADGPSSAVTEPDTAAAAARAATSAGLATSVSVSVAPAGATLAYPAVDGRPVSLWPYGEPVDPADPDAAPWEEAAVLLARLHRTRPPHPLPPMRGPAKAALAVGRMRAAAPDDPATGPVLDAWRALPAWARDEAPPPAHRSGYLCHGDLHLGQLVRHPAPNGPWLLIDVDDAGLGDPAWDLARPAAWYAAGLLPADVWSCFLEAYRAAGGPAVGGDGDPWPDLDVPARALTVQTAALALAKSAAEGRSPDEVEQMVIDACARIASLPPELAAGHAS